MPNAWTIVGTGAMACLWAAYLTRAGHSVTMIPRQSSSFNTKSLLIDFPDAAPFEFEVQIEKPEEQRAITNLLICTKAYDVASVLKHLESRICEDSFVLCCQNGMGIFEERPPGFPSQALFFASMTHGANKPRPDCVLHAGSGQCLIGPYGHRDLAIGPQQQAAIADLIALPLAVSWVQDIRPYLLRKLAINSVINPLTCLLDQANAVVLQAGLLALVSALCEEFAAVFAMEAHELRAEVLAVAEATQLNISSMLQDRRQHKRSEIDYINGYVTKIASERNIKVPLNQALLALIRQLQATSN